LFSLCLALIGEAGVIAYWRFEEVERIAGGNGLPFSLDETGDYGIYNPTLYDNVPTTVIPATGASNAHSTTGGYIGHEFGGTPIYLGNQFTIECYASLTSIQHSASLFGFGGRFQGSRLYLRFWNAPEIDGDDAIYLQLQYGQDKTYVSEPLSFVFDEWFHLAFVMDGEWSGVYLNGELWWEPEGALEDYYAWGNWQNYEMTIGNRWNGYIDEFRINDEALLPSQFLCAAIPEPSTLALLALGGGLLAAKRRRK